MLSDTGLAVVIGVAVGLGCTLMVTLCVLCILVFYRKQKENEKSAHGSSRFSRKSSIVTVSEWDGSTRDSQKIYRYRKNKQVGDPDNMSVISSKSLPLRTNSQSRGPASSLRLHNSTSNNSIGTPAVRPNSSGDVPTSSSGRRSPLKNIWNYNNKEESSSEQTMHETSVYVTGNDVTFAPLRGHDLPNSGVSFTNDGRLVVGGMPSLVGRGSFKLNQQHSIYK